MNKPEPLTRILAVNGAILVWLTVLAPFFLGLVSLSQSGVFRFDFLMPAEISPVALVGGALLFWAAWRATSNRRLIGVSLLLAFGGLAGSAWVATATGLATGEIEASGWPLVGTASFLGVYVLALVALGIGGMRLLRQEFKRTA